jgi:hypothetical protein
MSQTSYSQNLAIGRAGMLADNTDKDVVSRVSPTDDIPFGVAVVQGTADRDVILPTSAANITGQGKFQGIAIVDLSTENIRDNPSTTPPHFPAGEAVPVLRKGRVYVKVEENVTPLSPVFVRFANGIADNTLVQKGAFRASADGAGSTAQVATLTPTAVNATIYAVEILDAANEVVAAAEFLSDGSATATKIVTGLTAALGTVPGVTLSGTATLILTSTAAGVPFSVKSIGDGTIAVAATTPNVTGATTAAQLPNARYMTTALAGSVAVLEVRGPF